MIGILVDTSQESPFKLIEELKEGVAFNEQIETAF
jgi:hypothetical protein